MKKFNSVELLLNSASISTKEELNAEFREAVAEFGNGITFTQMMEMSHSYIQPEFNLENEEYNQANNLGLDLAA